jgi:hypothetical protein
LISEFRVRQELKAIEMTPAPAIRRARRIVRLARSVRKGALQMAQQGRQYLAEGDGARAVRFMTAARRLTELYEELRGRARAWLPSAAKGQDQAWKATFLIPEVLTA